MVQKEIRGLGFPGTTFATDDNTLVSSLFQHTMVSRIGDREDVRRQFRTESSVLVQFNVLRVVYRMELETHVIN